MFAWIRTPRGTHHCLSYRHDMWAFTRFYYQLERSSKESSPSLVYCLNVYVLFYITILESSFTNWYQHVRLREHNNNNWHLLHLQNKSDLGWIIHITSCTVAVCFHLHIRSHTSWIIMYWKVKYKHEKCTHTPMVKVYIHMIFRDIFIYFFSQALSVLMRLNNPQLCT